MWKWDSEYSDIFYGEHEILADNLIFGQWTSLSAGKPYVDQ